ncbi:MAG TPA: tetratricopeptide repeat protein [Inquilinus sp.]|nr:tetratricopeptide repeat protein [Inquilinus sp.]
MTDIFREVDEALREDRVKAIWRRYGTLIIAGAVAVVAATGAYVGWRSYSQSQAESQTRALVQAQAQAVADPKNAVAAYAAVAADSNADHAALARLLEARADLDAGKRDAAGDLYQQIAGDSGVNPAIRDLAKLYSVMARLDDGDPATLAGELAPLAADTSPWRFLAREQQGLLALRQADPAKAREIFGALSKDPAAPPGVRARADQLLSVSSN